MLFNRLPHSEALALMAVQKHGSPGDQWEQNRGLSYAMTLDFGLVDADGARIRGLHVGLQARIGKSVPYDIWNLTLFVNEPGWPVRMAYQLSVNRRPGLRPRDHDYPHEHIGDAPRQQAPDEWPSWEFDDAFRHFAGRIRLSSPLPPRPGSLQLRP